MPKPIIAVDIDDVLARSTESLRLEVNKRLKINLLPQHYAVPGDYWHYYERVWESNGVASRVVWDALSEQMIIDQSHVPAYKGAAITLQKLTKSYELIVITARDTKWESATKVWLQDNFPNIFSGIYFAGYKDKPQTKGQLCAELGASYLIEDNIEHAGTAIEQGIQVILFGAYGWHKNRDIHPEIVQCKTWPEVLRYFDGRDG